jgi:calcineurin-like phosphoesterase family protein
MDEALIDNFNSTVGQDDTLWFLGDFGFGAPGWLDAKTKALRCKEKNIVLGNHDRHSTRWWMDHGWTWASRLPVIFMDFIVLSHQQMFLEKNSPLVNLHGHCHNSLPYRPGPHYWNMCVEVTDYRPVNLEQILDEIKREGGEI